MLSEEQIDVIMCDNNPLHSYVKFARAIEAAVLEAQGKQDKTVTVRYDLSPAAVEGTIRGKLIKLGWTPPGYEAQKQEPVGTYTVSYFRGCASMMVLVPREPTEEMLIAGCKELGALYGHYGVKEAYRAMIAAYEGQP